MNRHRRLEAKRARRRRRKANRTPEQGQARQARRAAVASAGAERLLSAVLPGPVGRQRKPDKWVPIPCRCDPPQEHGPHWVAARRLKKDGDLYRSVKLDPVAREFLEAA
jgi:hypothetical protein